MSHGRSAVCPRRLHHAVVDTALIEDLPELEALPPEQVPPYFFYELYLDEEGLLRHAEFSLGGFELTADYTRYGSVESVEPPAPDEIITDNPFAGLAEGV